MSTNNGNLVARFQDNIIVKLPYKDLDDVNSNHFKTNLSGLLLKNKFSVLILDFSKVNLIDSNGVASIINAWHQCSNFGIHLILCNLNEYTLTQINSKGVSKLIVIVYSLDQAIAKGIEYTEKMKHLCQSYNKLGYIFGDLYKDNTSPTACKETNRIEELIKVT